MVSCVCCCSRRAFSARVSTLSSNGATLRLGSGSFVFQPGGAVVGGGLVVTDDAQAVTNVSTGVSMSGGQFRVNSGVAYVTGGVVFSASVQVIVGGGGPTATLNVVSGGGGAFAVVPQLTLGASGTINVASRLNNSAVLTMTGGVLNVSAGGVMHAYVVTQNVATVG